MSQELPITTVHADQGDPWLGLANPLRPLRTLWTHRELIVQLTRRDIIGRYRGSYLGIVWTLITPLLTLAVFTLVFGTRNRVEGGGVLDFAVRMFIGIILYGVFAECAQQAPATITANPNFVKKAVFPLELISISKLAAGIVHSLMALVIEFIAVYLAFGHIPATALLLPLLYIPIVFFTLGIFWLLSALGVFFRDLENAVGPVVQLMFFLTPIVYSFETLAAHSSLTARILVIVNPFVTIVTSARQLLIDGKLPPLAPLAYITAGSLVLAMVGYIVFMKLRRYFADAI